MTFWRMGLLGLGLLSLAACAPQTGFPHIADLPEPQKASRTAEESEALTRDVQAEGAAAAEAGKMVKEGEDLRKPLPQKKAN